MSVLPAPQHCLATFKLLWLSKKSSAYLEGKIFQPGNDNDAADQGPHLCHLPFRPLFELAPWPRQEQLIILLCLSRFIFPQLHTSLAPQSDSLSNIYSSIWNPLLILLWEPLPEKCSRCRIQHTGALTCSRELQAGSRTRPWGCPRPGLQLLLSSLQLHPSFQIQFKNQRLNLSWSSKTKLIFL